MIVFNGPVYDASGYATVSRYLIKMINQTGVSLKLLPDVLWSRLGVKLDSSEKKLFDSLKIKPNEKFQTDTLLMYSMQTAKGGSVPIKFNKVVQAVHTMFETDSVPIKWVDNLNRADFVFLPSKWGVDVFSSCGVRNIEYMPFPINMDQFSPNTPTLLNNIPQFKFLFMGDLSARKNFILFLKSFLFAFQNKKDVALIVKIWVGSKENVKQFVSTIRKLRKEIGCLEYPKIYLFNELMPESSIAGFINSCDCYVSPSCGEGFGLPHIYAMACEKPVISINWGACGDYLTAENGLPLSYEIRSVPYEIVKMDENFYGHQWAYPSMEHLIYLMKWVFQNREALPEIGRRARETVVSKYSVPVVQKMMEGFLKKGGLL